MPMLTPHLNLPTPAHDTILMVSDDTQQASALLTGISLREPFAKLEENVLTWQISRAAAVLTLMERDLSLIKTDR